MHLVAIVLRVGFENITADAVRAALAEHDRLGLAEFCDRYGFDRFRSYVIAVDEHRYGTRVVAAAAHGHLAGQVPLQPSEVEDEDLVNQTLKDLGFEVKELRPPKWSREELTLAASQLFSNNRVAQRANDVAVQELAELLQQLPFHALQDRGLNFRSFNSVQRKLFDLETRLPGYEKKQTRGGALDKVIVDEFIADEAEMHRRAEAIRAQHAPTKAWALDTEGQRAYRGDTAYQDVLGSSFVYDNNVDRSQQVREGHMIVIYDRDDVLGLGRISRIEHHDGMFVAHYGATWRALDGVIAADELKEACTDEAVQNAIRPLDLDKLEQMLGKVQMRLPSVDAETRAAAKVAAARRTITVKKARGDGTTRGGTAPKGGHRETRTKARIGQGPFRKELIRRYGHVCAITGRCPAEVLQAAHLRDFAEHGTHNLDEGVLLRADVHLLFDNDLLAVDPTTWRVVLAPSLSDFPAYAELDGAEFVKGPCEKAITDHFIAVTATWA